MCECVSVCVRESVSVCVFVRESVCVCERESVSVHVCVFSSLITAWQNSSSFGV